MKHRVIPSDPDLGLGESRNLEPAIKIIASLLSLIAFDQSTKLVAASFLRPHLNTGSILGLYIGKFPLFSLLIACLALVILISDIIRKKRVGFGEILILSGGLSNIIDRLVRPGVIDWIPFFGLWFNLADIYITIGVIYFILITYYNYNSPRPR